ncbi:hypothetical protein CWATWH0401_909, partial [Crocosphaera watsonii WH 0401]
MKDYFLNFYTSKIYQRLILGLLALLLVLFQGSFLQSYSLETEDNSPGFPVVFDHITLFNIYESNGSLSAQERATIITRRLNTIANDSNIEITDDKFDLDDRG